MIVIGGGSAGYAAASLAQRNGKKVAIVDSGAELGGLCILRGCMPSKTLIYSAEVLHLAQKGALFGLNIPSASVDMKALHERKKRVIGEFAQYRQEQLENAERFTLLREKASFTSPHSIRLASGKEYSARKLLIATGSVVNTPAIDGLRETPHWTSDNVLDLDFVPESVIVLGGGIVACELAQFLSRIGSKVTIIQRSARLLKEQSAQASEVIRKAFEDEGIEVITDTRLLSVSKQDGGIGVSFEHAGQTHSRSASYLLNALGRVANTAGMNLEAAGVELRASGHVRTNGSQQTSNPDIYAAGDVCGPHEIVHVAIMQGEVAARHALGQRTRPVDTSALTGVVFTDPQIARVGPSDEELAARGIETVSADYPFDDHGKSILMEAKYGYVKTVVDKADGRLLAAECVGKDASELIHALAVGVSLRARASDLLGVHWYHPTLAEIWSYPLEECVEALEG